MTPGRNDYGLPTGLKSNNKTTKTKKVDPKNLPVAMASYEPQGDMIEGNMSGQESQLKAKQQREKTVKTQILNKKLQLVRKGQGQSVQASYEPQGDVIQEMPDNTFRELDALMKRNALLGGKLLKNPNQATKFSDNYAKEVSKRSTNLGTGQFSLNRGNAGEIKVTPQSVKKNFPTLSKNSYEPQGDVLQELDLKNTGKRVLGALKKGVKKIFSGPIMPPPITKDQHLQQIRDKGGNPEHWANSFEPEGEMIEAKVDKKLPEYKRATARDKRYGNPHGSHELGGGIRKDRRADHEKRRGMKEDLDEGTSYGLYKGDGKPKGPMAKFADAKKKKKETVKEGHKKPKSVKGIAKELDKAVEMHKSQAKRLRAANVSEDMKGMSQKSGDKRSTESGAGMTAKGVAKYNRRTGGNLKTAVTTPPSKLKPGSKAAKRRKSFCARSKSWTGPRGKAARRRWNCEYEPELPMIPEATRQKKEMGYDKGGTKKPTTPKRKDKALDMVLSSIRKKHGKGAIMRSGSNQQKKVRGAKSTAGTGKYKKMADDKRQLKKDAKEMGYGSNTKGYVETRARYGSKENMKKGRGLGT